MIIVICLFRFEAHISINKWLKFSLRNTIPEVIYFGSHHDKLIAGNYFFKSSGKNIY